MAEPEVTAAAEEREEQRGEPDLPVRPRRRHSRLRDALIIAVALLVLGGVTIAFALLSGGDPELVCTPEHRAMGHC